MCDFDQAAAPLRKLLQDAGRGDEQVGAVMSAVERSALALERGGVAVDGELAQLAQLVPSREIFCLWVLSRIKGLRLGEADFRV